MDYPEITPERIRDFLKGRLTAEEAAIFRQQMAEDPALEEQVAFTRLLVEGLAGSVRRNRTKKRWQIIGAAIVVILGLSIFWLFRYSPAGLPTLTGVSVNWNTNGEVVIGGVYTGTQRLGRFSLDSFGYLDFFLAGTNIDGTFSWVKTFGSSLGNDYLTAVVVDSSDNIIFTGSLHDGAVAGNRHIKTKGKADKGEGDFFIAKMNPKGEILWLDHSGGIAIPNKQTGANLGTAVTLDQNNNIIAAGMYIGSPQLGHVKLPVGGPNEDLYLAKYNAKGQLLWATAATCDYNIYATSIATDLSGNIYMTGSFGHHNLSGKAYFGNITLQSYGGRDIFVAKYSPAGELLWARHAGSPDLNSQDSGRGIVVDKKGNCVVTGWIEGAPTFENTMGQHWGKRDAFLAKYDSSGNLLWLNIMGGGHKDQGNALCLDEKGNIYCTGHFMGKAVFGQYNLTSQGDNDIFVVRFNRNGMPEWVSQTGSAGSSLQLDSAHDIFINSGQELVITGMFAGKEVQYLKEGEPKNVIQTRKGQNAILLIFFDAQGRFIKAEQV